MAKRKSIRELEQEIKMLRELREGDRRIMSEQREAITKLQNLLGLSRSANDNLVTALVTCGKLGECVMNAAVTIHARFRTHNDTLQKLGK